MSEMYSLSDTELDLYRKIILEQLHKYKRSKSVESLTLFLIWLYEFVEMFAVNRQNKQGKLKAAKDFFNMEVITRLFRTRGELVHKRYVTSNEKIIKFYTDNETDLFRLMKAAGFIISNDAQNSMKVF